MAERRIFAKTIIDSDAFIDVPMSARLLYYDLGMRSALEMARLTLDFWFQYGIICYNLMKGDIKC